MFNTSDWLLLWQVAWENTMYYWSNCQEGVLISISFIWGIDQGCKRQFDGAPESFLIYFRYICIFFYLQCGSLKIPEHWRALLACILAQKLSSGVTWCYMCISWPIIRSVQSIVVALSKLWKSCFSTWRIWPLTSSQILSRSILTPDFRSLTHIYGLAWERWITDTHTVGQSHTLDHWRGR